MGIIPDAIINLVLTVAFGIYCAMGLVFFVMGIVYMGDAGAIGSTGVYLIFLGLLMLVIGGTALWANMNSNWLVLFVIELINIALFLVLYILVVVVLMMATGTTDPVREATVETWPDVISTLTTPGSSPSGDGTAASGTYCETEAEGSACTSYYSTTEAAPFQNFDSAEYCTFDSAFGLSQMQVLNNCSMLLDISSTNPDIAKCDHYEPVCTACANACMEAQIADVKENLGPVSVFTLFLMVYLVVVIVWNNVMLESDDIEGLSRLVGLILNGVLLLLAFVMLLMGAIGAVKASDACPGKTSCVPSSVTWLIILGVATMLVSGAAVAGVNSNNNMLIVIASIVMVFLAILVVLFALLLGMSTGVVMDDMTYYYDTQYPKLRSALEKADNGYCRMSEQECTNIAGAQGTTTTPVQAGDPLETITCDDDDVLCITSMSFDSLWQGMHAAAAIEANTPEAPPWLLENCRTTPLCIYCNPVLERPRTVQLGIYDQRQTAFCEADTGNTAMSDIYGACKPGYQVGDPCDDVGTGACVEQAANFEWRDALYGRFNNTISLGTSNWVSQISDEAGVGIDQMIGVDGATKCMGAQVDIGTAGFYSSAADVDHNPECVAPISSDPGNINYNVRCAGNVAGDAIDGWISGSTVVADTDATSLPAGDYTCTDGSDVLHIMNADTWVPLVNNFTRFDVGTGNSKDALPYCEEAIIDYVNIESNCVDYENMQTILKDSFYANCEQCKSVFNPFNFGVNGEDPGHRQCLNFWYGHMGQCTVTDDSCKAVFLSTATDSATNIAYMVTKAMEGDSSFCGYSDAGCKAKIKFDLEGSMTVIGVIGAVFMSFFLGIIYCTLQAIKSYKGGDDDDDDDE